MINASRSVGRMFPIDFASHGAMINGVVVSRVFKSAIWTRAKIFFKGLIFFFVLRRMFGAAVGDLWRKKG